jgi:hypothetical protein
VRARAAAERLLDAGASLRETAPELRSELVHGWLAQVFAGEPGGSA